MKNSIWPKPYFYYIRNQYFPLVRSGKKNGSVRLESISRCRFEIIQTLIMNYCVDAFVHIENRCSNDNGN